jgi:hypothetical protein
MHALQEELELELSTAELVRVSAFCMCVYVCVCVCVCACLNLWGHGRLGVWGVFSFSVIRQIVGPLFLCLFAALSILLSASLLSTLYSDPYLSKS